MTRRLSLNTLDPAGPSNPEISGAQITNDFTLLHDWVHRGCPGITQTGDAYQLSKNYKAHLSSFTKDTVWVPDCTFQAFHVDKDEPEKGRRRKNNEKDDDPSNYGVNKSIVCVPSEISCLTDGDNSYVSCKAVLLFNIDITASDKNLVCAAMGLYRRNMTILWKEFQQVLMNKWSFYLQNKQTIKKWDDLWQPGEVPTKKVREYQRLSMGISVIDWMWSTSFTNLAAFLKICSLFDVECINFFDKKYYPMARIKPKPAMLKAVDALIKIGGPFSNENIDNVKLSCALLYMLLLSHTLSLQIVFANARRFRYSGIRLVFSGGRGP